MQYLKHGKSLHLQHGIDNSLVLIGPKFLIKLIMAKIQVNLWSGFNKFIFQLLLGTVSEFKKKFENPILRGRDADASDADHKKGAEKLSEVSIIDILPVH